MPNPPRYLNRLIADWQELHPGITIKLLPLVAETDLLTWYRTQSSGAQLPDIFNAHSSWVNNDLPRGVTAPLNPYLEQGNPYVPDGQPGHDKWLDVFADWVLAFNKATDGNWYQVNGDFVGTAVYYNKDMFKQAGLDPENPPQTWSDFIEANRKLKASGMEAFVFPLSAPFESPYGWWEQNMCSQIWGHMYDELNADNSAGFLTQYSAARAFAKGYWNPDDARFQEVFRLLKDWSQYWMPGGNSLKFEDAYRTFVNGEVAMMWNGSWTQPQLQADEAIDFEWATFHFPQLDSASSEFATGQPSPIVGGPSGGFQWSISSQQANTTMTPEKLDAAADFLKFLTAPQNAGPLVNERGAFIPTIKGTTPSPALQLLVEHLDNWTKMFYMFANESILMPEGFPLVQEYLGGQTTLEQFMAKYKEVAERAVEEVRAKNNWDWDTRPTQ